MTTADNQPHGERRCYLRGCRRPECVLANKRYCKASDLRRHRQGPRYIDATEAAAHLRRLIDQGWTQTGIATRLGIKVATIGALATGRYKTCTPANARTILAFDPEFDDDCPGYWTSIIGPGRRIRALAVIGHPMYRVSEETGISYAAIRRIGRLEGHVTSKDFARRIADVYDRWRHEPGPSAVTRGTARSAGWHEPDAWQDIDDPLCKAIENRDELAALRRADIAHLAAFRIPEHEIAARLGMSAHYVHDLIRDRISTAA